MAEYCILTEKEFSSVLVKDVDLTSSISRGLSDVENEIYERAISRLGELHPYAKQSLERIGNKRRTRQAEQEDPRISKVFRAVYNHTMRREFAAYLELLLKTGIERDWTVKDVETTAIAMAPIVRTLQTSSSRLLGEVPVGAVGTMLQRMVSSKASRNVAWWVQFGNLVEITQELHTELLPGEALAGCAFLDLIHTSLWAIDSMWDKEILGEGLHGAIAAVSLVEDNLRGSSGMEREVGIYHSAFVSDRLAQAMDHIRPTLGYEIRRQKELQIWALNKGGENVEVAESCKQAGLGGSGIDGLMLTSGNMCLLDALYMVRDIVRVYEMIAGAESGPEMKTTLKRFGKVGDPLPMKILFRLLGFISDGGKYLLRTTIVRSVSSSFERYVNGTSGKLVLGRARRRTERWKGGNTGTTMLEVGAIVLESSGEEDEIDEILSRGEKGHVAMEMKEWGPHVSRRSLGGEGRSDGGKGVEIETGIERNGEGDGENPANWRVDTTTEDRAVNQKKFYVGDIEFEEQSTCE